MTRSLALIGPLVGLLAATAGSAQLVLPQLRSPDAIDHAQGLARRPFSTLPMPAPPAERYVPERRVYSPELGRDLVIPGHYERRISDQRVSVPTLPAYDPATGGTVAVPGGERPPAELRQGP